MKVVITGSLGRISKPLTQELLKKSHQVTVISSQTIRQKEIEALGAKAAIGTVEDVAFLTQAFTGADAVYVMLPPFKFMEDLTLDAREEARRIMSNYAQAIRSSGVKRVVHLSSIGAHTDQGNGILAFHYIAEQILKGLPADVSITHMRPVGFYYNLFDFMDMVKGRGFLEGFIGKMIYLQNYGLKAVLHGKKGIILSNYGGDDKAPWVSPIDIAAAIADEIITATTGRKVRYVASEELTCNEIASILGAAIGKPYLKWAMISDKQLSGAMKDMGAPEGLTKDIVEMNAGMHTGSLYEDYYKNKPVLGKVKMKDFAKEFAVVYNQNN